ncbi:Endonuclease/exonuclease/phosphatase [Hygrophoropsis aurantiaca]|uniref:Endonuclease/exonuclease/phosphatase n=1 Tax=Hygrophoropsis aurantiaca TaxID=72124 RepID=A0ACB8AJX5_9AGAM|nr:Endonuclease/exonuclease/phosphatase [Hygrophoropsis aurantiaca]
MPPKRKVVAKRKASLSDDEEVATKKPRKSGSAPEAASGTQLAPNGQPTNKGIPEGITFPPRVDGILRFATWNVAGLASAEKKGFMSYIEAEDPDILVMLETKVNEAPLDTALTKRYPYCTWSISGKKTYSGTAALSKVNPLSTSTALPGHPDPNYVKGRIITLEFEGCYVIATYAPNAGRELKTLDEKNLWNKHFEAYIRDLDKKKPVIWMGDLNVAPTATDLAHPKPNWNKTAGYTKDETEAFKNILDPPDSDTDAGKFVDVWRQRHPDKSHYTYFSYRFNCRLKGIGWRLDMFIASERLVDKVKMCTIRSEVWGPSDHTPVVMEIDREAVLGRQ